MLLVTGGVAIIGATLGCHMLWKKSVFRKKEIVEGTYLTRNYFLVFTFGLGCVSNYDFGTGVFLCCRGCCSDA